MKQMINYEYNFMIYCIQRMIKVIKSVDKVREMLLLN